MTTTDKVIVGLVGAAVIYESYTLVNKVKNDTISDRVWPTVAHRPLIPFLLGMVLGHFVWQSQDVYDRVEKEEIEQTPDGPVKVTTKIKKEKA